jgi:hypothetical protein
MFKQYKKSIKYFNTPLRLLLVCALFSLQTQKECTLFSSLYEQRLFSLLVLLFCVCGTSCGGEHERQTFDSLAHSQSVQPLPPKHGPSRGCVPWLVC